ncbi:hypothetical protein Pfo_027354 [Paulownia fortunei]|nr:hypothetical protein Pfo_027354 [Paulownia fortunei]
MGCFPACFGPWKHKETMKKVQDQSSSPSHELHEEAVTLLAATTESMNEEETVNPIKPVSESECKSEEQMNTSKGKKAAFDQSTNEHIRSNSDKLVDNENGKVEKKREKGKDDGSESNLSSPIPYPANDGHQDFLTSDKECVAVNSKEITLDDNSQEGGIGDCCPVQEDSSESLFSLSIDSRKHVSAAEMGDKEVSSPLKLSDRDNNSIGLKKIVHLLMNPVENSSFKYDEDKENVNLEEKWIMPLSKEPILKQSLDKLKPTSDQFKPRDNEIAVDTSLSSWLVESEKSSHKTSIGNSPESEKNYGERRILRAITPPAVLKQLNVSSSAGSTPYCSGDGQPGIGTVGRYWRQTGLAWQLMSMGSGSSCRGTCEQWREA